LAVIFLLFVGWGSEEGARGVLASSRGLLLAGLISWSIIKAGFYFSFGRADKEKRTQGAEGLGF
jgi:hypothetical protein